MLALTLTLFLAAEPAEPERKTVVFLQPTPTVLGAFLRAAVISAGAQHHLDKDWGFSFDVSPGLTSRRVTGAATEACACSACLEQEASPAEPQTGLGEPPQHTFGVDVLRCPCGGRRRIIAIHSNRKAGDERLTQLGHHLLPRRLLPPATAQPTLPLAG